METISINRVLFNSMIQLYSESAVKKLIREFNKLNYIKDLSCKTAVEFDKISELTNIDKITEFVSLQIIIRTVADDKNYSKNIIENKDILIQEIGLTFNNDVVDKIKEISMNDPNVKKGMQEYAIEKMLKMQQTFDDYIVYLTKAFITAVKR
jgi:hypothetical protein